MGWGEGIKSLLTAGRCTGSEYLRFEKDGQDSGSPESHTSVLHGQWPFQEPDLLGTEARVAHLLTHGPGT